MLSRPLASLLLSSLLLAGCGGGPPRATYQARHEFEVSPPAGAGQVRAWFALPQEDSSEEVKDLKVESPFGHRVTTDSEGNRTLYVEASAPQGPFKVVTTFKVARSEIRTQPDPKMTRPLSPEEKQVHQRDLKPNQHMVINEEIQRLSRFSSSLTAAPDPSMMRRVRLGGARMQSAG